MISAAMDLLLAGLLLAGLVVGIRLEKRLRILHSSHTSFAAAVTELNQAVARAEEGLIALKAATNEAQTLLVDRVHDARSAAAKLDEKLAGAETAAQKLESRMASAAQFRPASRASEPRMDGPRAIERRLAEFARETPAERDAEPLMLNPRLQVRSRARIDDDLFDAPAGRVAVAAGRQ
jgi:hypothetical protein